jgi:hypothetical protein
MTITDIDCFIATISRASGPISTPVSKLGGKPVFVAQLEAPHCQSCGQLMDFIGQFRLDSPLQLSRRFQIAYVFMCPGQYDERGWLTCSTWEAFSGANTVLLQEDNGLALLPGTPDRYPDYELTFRRVPEPDLDVSRFDLADDERDRISYTTKFGGVPAWVQNNETPHCPHCGKDMRFVAQIDAELDGPLPADTAEWDQYHFFDFGDVGLGYVFICPNDCSSDGAFLWQST